MNFKSDNIVPVHDKIMDAIVRANHGIANSYGNDDYSAALEERASEVFEKNVKIYLTNTGTAANCLGLASLVRPYEAVYCHEESHVNNDESGAPELFTSGAKLVTLLGDNGKIDLELLQEKVNFHKSLRPHAQKPGCITLTQATECGTIYSLDELLKIKAFAKQEELPIHMDGARFANALVSLGCTPAEVTWKSGVDVMSFGGTKNGGMCAEMIIFFNEKHVENFDHIHKRGGQLVSKMRFFSSQFLAYLEDDVWIQNAKHANKMAKLLEGVFKRHEFKSFYPVEANEIFIKLPLDIVERLRNKGASFYDWGLASQNLYRFVTSFHTSVEQIETFGGALKEIQ